MPIGSRLAAIVIAGLIVAACGTDDTATATRADVGGLSATDSTEGRGSSATTPAASLRGRTLEGAAFDFANLHGHPTVIWFWAPWCTICRAEAPSVARVAADVGPAVTFLGVPGLGEPAAMKRFVTDTGIGGFPQVVDSDGAIWSAFGVVAQPAFAFIDAAGSVKVVSGALTRAELESAARALTA